MIKKILTWFFGVIGGLLLFNSLFGTIILDTWEFDKKIVDTNLIGSMFIGILFLAIAIWIHESITPPQTLSTVEEKKDDSVSIDCQYCGASFELQTKPRKSQLIRCPNCGGPNKLNNSKQ